MSDFFAPDNDAKLDFTVLTDDAATTAEVAATGLVLTCTLSETGDYGAAAIHPSLVKTAVALAGEPNVYRAAYDGSTLTAQLFDTNKLPKYSAVWAHLRDANNKVWIKAKVAVKASRTVVPS